MRVFRRGRQDGLATGRKEGSEDGVRAGRGAAQLEDALEQFLVFFLAHIDTLAKEASAERPNKDKLRDAAIALRESARRGRESFEEILKQLNGTIDELYQAVESGNMDRTISLARAITNNRKTIEAQIKAARAKLLRKSPYSLRRSPRAMERWRMAMLCSFEPVK